SFMLILVAIVIVQEGARKIPVQTAKVQRGGRVMQGRTSYIPFKVNQGGVMPIIFASSLLLFPVTISSFMGAPRTGLNPSWEVWTAAFWNRQNLKDAFAQGMQWTLMALSPSGWLYPVLYFLLIIFFSYFYASMVLNPNDLANTLKK